MIDWNGQWLQRTRSGPVSEPTRSKLIQRYEAQLESYQLQLAKSRFQASLATKRLSQLLAYWKPAQVKMLPGTVS